MTIAAPAGHPSGTSRAGTVVVDIGGRHGAAIVYVDPRLDGAEIEIRSDPDGSWDGTHTAVRPRIAGGRTVHAALFEQLAEGTYELRLKDTHQTAQVTVTVTGGMAAEVRWPTGSQRSGGTTSTAR